MTEHNMPITVYFDTSFYVWLAKAEPSIADSVIYRLNRLEVKHVLSSHILHELLSGSGRDSQDQRLVERVGKLSLEPCRIQYGHFQGVDLLEWNLLLLAGEQRDLFAKFLQSVFDNETVARSLSSLAERRLSENDQERVQKALEPFLYALGITSESSDAERIQKFSEFGHDLTTRMGEFLPAEKARKLKSIDISPESITSNPSLIAENFLTALGEPTVEKLEREKELINSSVTLESRPLNVVVGDASKKEFMKLGNTFRDAVHMGIFLANREKIDLLQVDSRQLALIHRPSPIHALREAGVADRCFAVRDILEAVSYIEKYASTRESSCAE
ncbi:MAG: hypothetical protein IPM50_07505 [Acidobacteriota bacterium]|nr:MAG: hypothetical protein IPM50_07505 [Acidobacteriota bacterium]